MHLYLHNMLSNHCHWVTNETLDSRIRGMAINIFAALKGSQFYFYLAVFVELMWINDKVCTY